MASAAVDVSYLSQHLSVPEVTITSVIDAPTAELVNSVLMAVAAKAQEFEELQSEKMQVDIAYETAVRGAESHSEVLARNRDEALQEVQSLRVKLQEQESRSQTLQNELQSLKASTSTSTIQAEELQLRITRLEEAKKEAFSLVDTKNKANDELGEELQKLHKKNVELSQEISSLQKTAQSDKNTLSSVKFKEQSLQQELEMNRRTNQWLEDQLKNKSEEYLKYRKDKGARIAELQRLNDDAISNIEHLTRTNEQLRTRLTDAQQKTDDAFLKIQQLNESIANVTQNFEKDRESQNRLVELKDQQLETYKKRTKELEQRIEHLKDEAEATVRLIRRELEETKQERDGVEQKLHEMEKEMNFLRVSVSSQAHPITRPQTPLNGSIPSGGSPLPFTPGSVRSKAAGNTSQLLDELYRIKALHVTEKNKNAELRANLDDMMAVLESKAPELQELQDEKEHLEAENEKMTRLADEAFKNRDDAKKTARKAEATARTAQAEVEILQSQLRDLSTQLQMLLFNQAAQEKGVEQLSLEETQQLNRLARGEVAEGSLADLSDTHQFISRQYVVYKDIFALQEQNKELLRVTRELANQMESEEALQAKRKAAEDHEELQKLRDANEILQDEVKSLQIRNNTYIQERDIFRRVAQQKANAGDLASVLGGSVDGSQPGVLASIEPNAEEPDYAALLRELQHNFDAYRDEQAVDRKTLKEQAQKLVEEKNNLQAELSRISSQLTLASERYDMLHSNFVALQNENRELQRRNQALSESAAKQDASLQKLAEEHVEDRAMLETMRSENANLKAEKKLWKDIQERLNQTNENLTQEKSQLGDLLASQQRIQNERDLADSENRRRLQNQIDGLESELGMTKKKLAEQVEESKNLQLRKEFDFRTSQSRIDELSKSLSQAREEHVATRTSRDHLQARVNELIVQLRNAEERAERLIPIPSSRPRAPVTEQSSYEEAEARVQELTDEVADVKRELNLANAQLENAKAQTEQYRALLNAHEQDLQSLTETQEQYRQEMEQAVITKDGTIKELEQRIEQISNELATSNRELSSLRDAQAEVTRRFEDKKTMLEEDIKRLRGAEDRFNEMVKCHRQDLRAQADIAAKAQQDYEVELVKHADAAKALQTLRIEFNELKTESASLRARAESAQHTLAESENSWEERRKALEQEISEIKARRDEANKTNSLLQQEYNKVMDQIKALQQNRPTASGTLNDNPVDSTGTLQEINDYLRREKEILEVQHDLKIQEAKRLQQQLDYTQAQLDETRLKLDEERRSHADNSRNSIAHKELMEKLTQLNLFRESNAALRSELQQAKTQIDEKNIRISELEGRIQPLEARSEELENQKSFLEQEIKQLQEDRDRWQKRTEGILTKYGRADPEEVEQLKQSVAALESERNSLKEEQQPLQAKVEELENQVKASEERRTQMKENLTRQFKERSQQQNLAKNQAIAEKDEAIAAKTEAETQLAAVNSELSLANEKIQLTQEEKDQLEQQFNNMREQIEVLQQEAESARAAASMPDAPQETTADVSSTTEPEKPNLETEQRLTDTLTQLESLNAEKIAVDQELAGLRIQLEEAVTARDEALSKLEEAVTARDEALSKLESCTPTLQNGTSNLSDEERNELLRKLADAEVSIEEAVKSANARAEEVIKTRSEKMKSTLNHKLSETREQLRKENEDLKNQMEKEFQVRLEQEKVIWKAENKTAENPPTTPAKPTSVIPSTPITSTPINSSTSSLEYLNKLSDSEVRDFISKNATAKAILSANIKKRIDIEMQKLNSESISKEKSGNNSSLLSAAEVEAKIAAAKEQATMMETKKSSLRINMAENKFKTANFKVQLVSKAAQETPQKPIIEVWSAIKDAKPPAPNATSGTSASTTSTPANLVTSSSQDAKPKATPTPVNTKPATTNKFTASGPPTAAPSLPSSSIPAHPSGSSLSTVDIPMGNNAAAPKQEELAVPGSTPASATIQNQQFQQQQQQRHSSLPMPSRGGGNQRGRGGVYQAPRGGRGRGGARGGLNPGAEPFTTGAGGNKRPRGDSEAGANKRMRGGAGGGAPAVNQGAGANATGGGAPSSGGS